MSFNITFIYNKKTKLITLFKEIWCRWIMRCSYGIDIELFHKKQILINILLTHCISVFRMGVVMVHTLELYGYSIYQKLGFIGYLN